MSVKTSPSLKDLADAAGVSVSTVSRVLSGNLSGTSILHKKIINLAEEGGYMRGRRRISRIDARYMSSSGKPLNGTIAVYGASQMGARMMDPSDHYYPVVNGVCAAAEAAGWHVLVSQLNQDDEQGVPAALQQDRVDGVMLYHSMAAGYADRISKYVPVVVVNAYTPCPAVSCVRVDNRAMMMEGIGHLAELGHKRLAYFDFNYKSSDRTLSPAVFDLSWSDQAEHYMSYIDALKVLDLEDDEVLRWRGSVSSDADHILIIASLVERWMGMKNRPTAIVCGLVYTICVAQELARLGLRIPQDVSLLAVNNAGMADVMNPPVTTIGADHEKISSMAFEYLKRTIENAAGRDAITTLVKPRLTVRQSTAPPGK